MSGTLPGSIDWTQALRRYLAVSIAANLVWEILQLPLFTLWTNGSLREQAFAIVHCTIGDAMIAGLSLLGAISLSAKPTWPETTNARVFQLSVAFGLAYTVYSEWLNTSVRGSWTYSDWMPVIPILGTGVSPLMQWLVVPTLAYWTAIGRRPWSAT